MSQLDEEENTWHERSVQANFSDESKAVTVEWHIAYQKSMNSGAMSIYCYLFRLFFWNWD